MQGGNKVVIVVDDDAFAQQVLTTIFTGLKVEPIICADGKKAFDAYVARNGSSLAYVLMDIHMPVMDGYEVEFLFIFTFVLISVNETDQSI